MKDINKVNKILKLLTSSRVKIPLTKEGKTDFEKYNDLPHVIRAKDKLVEMGITYDFLSKNFGGLAIVLDLPDSPLIGEALELNKK